MQNTLDKVTVKNFQTHCNSELPLHSGVSIISGNSDSGKSSLLRAVNLVLSNRPTGFGFKPWSAKKKDVTECKLEFSDGTVERRKSETIDEYILTIGDEVKEFKSLNRTVPDEIKDFLNLADYNFQDQEEGRHFFISESPAHRAQMLNEISGLGIIDQSLSNVNSLIRENNSKQKQVEDTIKSLSSEIDKIKFIDEADKLLVQIEELFINCELLELMNNNLNTYIQEIQEIESKILEYNKVLKHKKELQELQELIKKHNELETKQKSLNEYVANINNVQEVIQSNTEFLKCKELYTEIISLIKKHNELETNHNTLKKFVIELTDVDSVISNTSVWLECKTSVRSLYELITAHGIKECENKELNEYIDGVEENNKLIKCLNTKVQEAKEKRKQFMIDMGECPLCGNKVQ
ncbi:MAG: AAA family ATPase [Melioribacteraceae bacterium]